jgi:hypothetical protein
MTTPNPSGSYGPEDTADLVRSVALSSVRLWEEVLERLARVELAQAELAQSLARLQGELPPGSAAATLAPGTSVLAPPPPPGLEAPSSPHFVAPPPPPPPGVGPLDALAPEPAHVEGSLENRLVDVQPIAADEPTTGPVPIWSDAATTSGDGMFDLPSSAGDVPPPPPPPPPPPGFGSGPTNGALDTGLVDAPPPPPGFQSDFPVVPPPPPAGFGSVPGATEDIPAPPGFSAEDLSGFGAIGEPTPPPGFATTAGPPAAPSEPPLGPPPSAPPGFSVADLTGGDAIGSVGAPDAPPPPPGFSAGTDLPGPGPEGGSSGFGSDPFGDLLGDLDSADASTATAPDPASPTGGTPPPPPGFSTTGGGSFADLPIITPEPAADASPEPGGVPGATPAPVPGREGAATAPRTEPPITPDFFARSGRRKR